MLDGDEEGALDGFTERRSEGLLDGCTDDDTEGFADGLFDGDADGTTEIFYGKTKEIGYYDTALTDLELETLTSYRSWESMVNELNLNIIYNG